MTLTMNWNHTLFFIFSMVCTGVTSISNGTFISIEEAPFYVTIFPNNILACGGSIISEYWIVTAAHCFEGYAGNIVVTIGTGSSTIPITGNYYAEKIIIHKNYTPTNVGTERYDISLIKLSESIKFNEFQQPIQIAQDPLKVGDKTTIYGLGVQGSTRTATLVLKKIELDIINQDECRFRIRSNFYLQSDVFCIGDGLTLTCSGDSGGPIVVDGKLVGIVSRGALCKGRYRGYPNTHVRVHKHYDWIINNTGIKY